MPEMHVLQGFDLMGLMAFCMLCGKELTVVHTPIDDVVQCNNHETTIVPELDMGRIEGDDRNTWEVRGIVLRVLSENLGKASD